MTPNNTGISYKKVSVQNLVFNYSNAIFAIINGLVLLPLYLKHFSLSTYGSYLSSGNIVAMLGLLESGLSMVITQKLAIAFSKNDFKTFSKILGSGLFVTLCIVIFILLLSVSVIEYVPKWVKAEIGQYRNIKIAFILSAISAGLGIAYSNIAGIFQAWLKVKVPGITNLGSIVIGILVTILSLHSGFGVISIPLGMFAKWFTGVISLIVILLYKLNRDRYPKIRYEHKCVLELISSSFPILFGNIGKSAVTNSQLLIITSFMNPIVAAIFSITGKIYQVCDLFLAPIGSSIFSSITHLSGVDNKMFNLRDKIIQIFSFFTSFEILLLVTSFSINRLFISWWVGYDKYGGEVLSLLMCISMFLYSRMNFLIFNLYALGIFGKTALYDFIATSLKLLLILLLIRSGGIIIIPIAEIFSTLFISSFFINKFMAQKLNITGIRLKEFVFLGLFELLITVILSIIVQKYCVFSNNLINLIESTIMYIILFLFIIFLCNKNLYIIVKNFFLSKIFRI